ncbi:hypothetical protein NQ317_000976 [Molorchus minor]|uniref:Ionotropic glutamate receptor C-terminal domain-containing protein n=1 Tax=Molorchus minor TaxID=1323400 RepID=A0ABQ9JP31_9CUCU|nr:hypothetical protein NQ317_000976 [Molorchus minor]
MKGGLSSIQNCIWYMYGALLQTSIENEEQLWNRIQNAVQELQNEETLRRLHFNVLRRMDFCINENGGGMHLPYADSARIIVGSWWLVVLVIATTYCGNLVAFLTFPKIDIPITTLDELISHRDTVTWSFRKGSFLDSQLMTSTEMRFKTIYDNGLREETTTEMIKQVVDGKHVYIDWKIRLQYLMKKQYLQTYRCDLALGLDDFFDEQLALIVAQDMPYLPVINSEIKKITSSWTDT